MTGFSTFIVCASVLTAATVALLLRPWQLVILSKSQRSMPKLPTSLGILLIVPLAAATLYASIGNRNALEPDTQPATPHATGQADVQRMVLNLAQKLEQHPEDAKGWAMLARSWKVLGRYGEAEQAFAKAAAQINTDPDLLTEYADVAAMRNGGKIAGKPADLVKQALRIAPEHPTALWMSGTFAYQRKDYPTARQQWQRLLQVLPDNSPDRNMIEANLEEIRLLQGEAPSVQAAKASIEKPVKPMASATSADIRGTVKLSPQLAGKVSPDDAVFVFARAVNGSKMPLAVLRARARDLPLDFVLDSSNAMNPQLSLANAGTVIVEARISKHGDVKAQPGDLVGERDNVKVGSRNIQLLVSKMLP